MTAADRAEEALRDELDMLCMPQPSSLQIAAVRQATEGRHVA